MTKPVCPRCGHMIPNDEEPGAYMGARSRWDNKTEVCSKCGTEEALLQFAEQTYRDGDQQAVVHPVTGAAPWVSPPVTA